MSLARMLFLTVCVSMACCSDHETSDVDAAVVSAADASTEPDAASEVDSLAAHDPEPTVACADMPAQGARCSTAGEVCGTPSGCCVCGDGFGFCTLTWLWVCATPAANAAACPPDAPNATDECTIPFDVRCEYCDADNTPFAVSCSDPAHARDSACKVTGAPSCMLRRELSSEGWCD